MTDIGLEEGAVDWPGPGTEPAGSPLAKVREELVQQSGVARRLDRSLAMRAEANQVAKDFVEDTDPGRYVPGARGRFEAMVVRNDDLDGWHVVVRFVAEGPAAAFLDVVEWFEGWLAPIVRRPLKAGTYWCGQWQEHAEAVERTRALWEVSAAARAEGGNAMSYWWTVHFDAHWAALADSAGGPSRRVRGGASTVPTSGRFRTTSTGTPVKRPTWPLSVLSGPPSAHPGDTFPQVRIDLCPRAITSERRRPWDKRRDGMPPRTCAANERFSWA